MLTAVLFDFDLTLGRPVGDMSVPERQAHLYQSVGLPYTDAEIAAAMRERRTRVASGALPGVARPQRKRDLLTAYRQTLRLLGYAGDVAAKAEELYHGYAVLPFAPYDDARPTLQALRAAGYRLGILSNHTPAARPTIEAEFGDLIPPRQIIISGEERVHKPRPSLFSRAAARVGARPAQCAFVGDNVDVDGRAAVAAGFALGIWVDREHEAAGSVSLPPHVVRITSLAEIPALLSSL
ncbi:MAG: HAD family hydrolase [Anaerolineae bacterium]